MKTKVEFIEFGLSYGDDSCLVRKGDRYYVVSHIGYAADHGGPETLVFPARGDGMITDWTDVAGGPGVSPTEAIAQLERNGDL